MRRVAIWGLLGAVPGGLIIGTVGVLNSLDVITDDQTQGAFIAIPILFLGLIIGVVAAASKEGVSRGVGIGLAVGLVVGIAVGIPLDRVWVGAWLVVAALGMLIGSVVGAWWVERRARRLHLGVTASIGRLDAS